MSPITCMQTPPPHLAGSTPSQPRPSLLSPLQSSFLHSFLFSICSFSLRRPSSPSHRGGVTWAPAARSTLAGRHRHKYEPSARCIISPRYLYARPTSPQQVDPSSPLTREAAATSCIYITHHLLHPPIRSRSREADLGST